MKKNNLFSRLVKFIFPAAVGAGLMLPMALHVHPVTIENHEVSVQTQQARADRSSSEYLPKNLFIELGKEVNPAVVNISTTQVIRATQRGFGGYPMMPMPNDPFRQFFEDFMGPNMGPPAEEKVQSLGSGFIIEPNGLIVTNYHVIQNATEIQIQLTEQSKKLYKAKVVGSDKRTDIALIKIAAEKPLPTVPLGDSDKVEVGEWVAAFGNPFGHGHSMTKGIISAKDRDIEIESSYYAFLQTDASINPGNSGGPLVNTDGAVIGVNSAIDARAQGIGFAIPINVVKKLLPILKSKGHVVRGFLGVGINNIDDQMVKQFHLKNDKGVIVLSVTPGSPADKAGIRPYDIITKLNGREISDARDLTTQVADIPIGETANLEIVREGHTMDVTARISERPDEMASRGQGEDQEDRNGGLRGKQAPYDLGMSLVNLNPQIVRDFDLHDVPSRGVVVSGIRENSLAYNAGIQVGDVILDVNRRPVRNTAEAIKAFHKGNNNLRILRDGQTIIIFMETEG